MNLKVGGTGPLQSARNFLLLVGPLHFFGFKSTISRFGERFHDGQYSLTSFLFAVLLFTVPPCPMESAPLRLTVGQYTLHSMEWKIIFLAGITPINVSMR